MPDRTLFLIEYFKVTAPNEFREQDSTKFDLCGALPIFIG